METMAEKYYNFIKAVLLLQSFPVAVAYLILIPTSLLWKRFTSPLGLQKVYHHTTILLLSDYACHFTPWPAIGVPLGMNSFVHIFLYLYYGQSALQPTHRPQWKKKMTQLQMFQFVIGIIHSSFGYAHHGFCIFSIFYAISMLGLFGNFYYHAFLKVRRDKKTE